MRIGESPEAVRTRRSTVPPPLGAIAVSIDDDETVKRAAGLEPKRTAVTPTNRLPVTLTLEPPSAGPDNGEIAVTVGPAR